MFLRLPISSAAFCQEEQHALFMCLWLLLPADFLVAFLKVVISFIMPNTLEFLEVGQDVINLHKNIKIFILSCWVKIGKWKEKSDGGENLNLHEIIAV